MYISESVKEGLREYAGQCVQIDAKSVHQPINPGDGLIGKFTYLGPAPDPPVYRPVDGLSLSAAGAFAEGQPPCMKMTIRNAGDNDVTVRAEAYAPTLLVRKAAEKTHVYPPSDGPSFALITRQGFALGDDEPRVSGIGTVAATDLKWRIDEALPDKFVLKAGETRDVKITFELPEGEYDFLAGYGGGVHEYRCIAGNLVAFDVDRDGKGSLVTIEGR